MSQLTTRVPVGFRFHPTDEELVGYYLPKKVNARKIDLDLIRELDLYKLEPWELQDLCKIQAASDSNEKQTDCYFFSRKDKKYPTGNRANRATAKGFWKATGRDKPISAKLHTRLIGMRKTLVFYQGRAPHGIKTDWIMHEFRLDDGPGRPAHEDGGWVVCRVFKKNKNLKMKLQERAVSYEEQLRLLPEPLGSPEILSGGHFAFPDHNHYSGGAIKQEFINLDDYQSHHQYVNNLGGSGNTTETNNNTSSHNSMLSSSSTMVRTPLSFRRPGGDYLNMIPGSPPSFQADFNNDVTTSGSDGGGDGDEAILGLEHVDWSALLQEPPKSTMISGMNDFSRCPGSGKSSTIGSDLVLIKRQNSDIFSPMDLWNYSQVAQHM